MAVASASRKCGEAARGPTAPTARSGACLFCSRPRRDPAGVRRPLDWRAAAAAARLIDRGSRAQLAGSMNSLWPGPDRSISARPALEGARPKKWPKNLMHERRRCAGRLDAADCYATLAADKRAAQISAARQSARLAVGFGFGFGERKKERKSQRAREEKENFFF